MSYNLLLNTTFKDTVNWNLINCTIDNGILTSSNKIFGIYQEIIISKPTNLYLSAVYKSFSNLKDVKIGIQDGDRLEVNIQNPKLNKQKKISVVSNVKNCKIKLHIIFESDQNINRVLIKEPLLVDLDHLNKSTWTKGLLDLVLKYRHGYSYTNEYNKGEVFKILEDRQADIVKAKIGSVLKTKENLDVELSTEFKNNHYYLVKLDYDNINDFGKIYFKYGVLKSSTEVDNQSYLIFKGNDNIKLHMVVESDPVIAYRTNLKHILIADITYANLLQEDIIFLPFI